MRSGWGLLVTAAMVAASPAWAQEQQAAPPQDDPLAPLDSQLPKDTLSPTPAPPPTPRPPSSTPPAPLPQVTPADEAGSIHPYVPPRAAPKDWQGVFAAIQRAVPHLGNTGRIINIGSINADRVPGPGLSIYAMSKAAVAGLTRGLARDLGPRGITVNNIG